MSNGSFQINSHNDNPTYEEIRVQRQQKSLQSNSGNKMIHHTQSMSNSSSKKQFENEHQTKQQIRVIFFFYASFGDRTNINCLKSNKFIKLISDAQLIEKFQPRELDILYYQETKNTETLNLNQFQQLLLKLSSKLYPNLQISQAFHQMYEKYFAELYTKISQYTEFGQGLLQIQEFRNRIAHFYDNVLHTLLNVLTKIHQYVFKEQSQRISKVQSQYLWFLTQFEVIPNTINQSQAQTLFMDLIYRDSIFDFPSDPRYLLSLSKFIESLVIISMFQDPNLKQLNMNQFIFFLDRIENSKGFENFSKTQFQTKNESTQLVMAVNRLYNSRVTLTQSVMPADTEIKYEKELKSLFQYYAQLGEPTNLESLKSMKFIKMLQSSGILQKMSAADADMIYIQSTPKKKYDSQRSPQFKTKKLYDVEQDNGKMNFKQFLQAINSVANKFFDGDLITMIEQYLLPQEAQQRMEKQEQVLQLLMQLLNDEEILRLYEVMQHHFDPYYNHYSQGEMKVGDFMRFCRDFELSNQLVSKGQLLHIFKAMSSLNKEEAIDRHQFIEAISVIGMLVYQNVPSNYQKIILLLERITQTDGAVKISKLLGVTKHPQDWSLIEIIRSSRISEQPKQSYNFDEIVEQAF